MYTSNTMIVDSNFYGRQIANEINKAARRCKIGKVTPKVKPYMPSVLNTFSFMDFVKPIPDLCAGCKGACGNVACPRRMVTTC